jgi:hypothetical protein
MLLVNFQHLRCPRLVTLDAQRLIRQTISGAHGEAQFEANLGRMTAGVALEQRI